MELTFDSMADFGWVYKETFFFWRQKHCKEFRKNSPLQNGDNGDNQ